MGVLVTFGNLKHKKIAYATKRALGIGHLYSFFRTRPLKYIRSKEIHNNVKISNITLWNLAYQGFLRVRPRFCKYIDNKGMTRFAQVYYWKANIPRFEQFLTEAKMSLEIAKKKAEERKKTETVDPLTILQNGEDYINNEEEDVD